VKKIVRQESHISLSSHGVYLCVLQVKQLKEMGFDVEGAVLRKP
jgi:hypothetical protein